MGLLPGSDPKLADEAVLYTAHHDHLGLRTPPVAGERNVYAGALDNASGCASVLAIARALAAAPPRRSVVVAFVTAEEQGLLGSHWYATHPTVHARPDRGRHQRRRRQHPRPDHRRRLRRPGPVLDGRRGAGRPPPRRGARCTATPSPTAARSTARTTSSWHASACRARGSVVAPATSGHRRAGARSSAIEYERHHYHQPATSTHASPESWDLSGAVEDAQLQLVIGLRVGNAPALPAWKHGRRVREGPAVGAPLRRTASSPAPATGTPGRLTTGSSARRPGAAAAIPSGVSGGRAGPRPGSRHPRGSGARCGCRP